MSKKRTAVNVLLVILILGLSGYVVWLSQSIYDQTKASSHDVLDLVESQSGLATRFAGMYRDSQNKLTTAEDELALTKKSYDESQEALNTVTQQLALTKNILMQTQNLLAQVKDGSADPKKIDLTRFEDVDLNKLSAKENQLQNSLAALDDQNKNLTQEVENLKRELARYDGNVSNMTEARNILSLLRDRVTQVKSKIRDFKNQTLKTKILALRERDKIRSVLGNNGYLVREGQLVSVDLAKYHAADTKIFSEAQATKSNRKIGINVTFFK